MPRRPLFLRAFLAFFVFWLPAQVFPGGTKSAEAATLRGAHDDAVMLSAVPTPGARVASPKKAAAPDWSSGSFVPARGLVLRELSSGAPPALSNHGLRDRESLTVTYDATAPPAASPHSVH